MLLTLGKVVRKNVCGVRLGEERVAEVRHGGVLIWPTLTDTIARCVLDVTALDGTLAGARFAHALAALDELGASEECFVMLRAGGREYMLGSGFGLWDVAGWDGHATVDFGDYGPLGEALKVGDKVSLRLVVPSRHSAVYGGEAVCALPFLEGTDLIVTWHKGQKKVRAGRSFTVTGEPSGVVHFGGLCYTDEHKRHDQTRVLPGNTHKWAEAVYDGSFVPGDTSLSIETETTGSGSSGGVQFLFPAIEATVRLDVVAVTYHD